MGGRFPARPAFFLSNRPSGSRMSVYWGCFTSGQGDVHRFGALGQDATDIAHLKFVQRAEIKHGHGRVSEAAQRNIESPPVETAGQLHQDGDAARPQVVFEQLLPGMIRSSRRIRHK